jgi:hypothetical protein
MERNCSWDKRGALQFLAKKKLDLEKKKKKRTTKDKKTKYK